MISRVITPRRQGRRAITLLAVAGLVASTLAVSASVLAAKPVEPTFVDYAQCANDPPPATALDCPGGWINGILQGSNSHYTEDQVTPQRAEVAIPSGAPAAGHTLTFTYQTRKGSASTHAYDSLATWNYTQTGADRCQGLNANDCVGGAPHTFPIPDDPTELAPYGAGKSPVTADHMLPVGAGRVFTMYGGTITDVSDYTHSCSATNDCDDPSVDDYASITITYTAGSVPGKVQLLFGGHLAQGSQGGSRTWGLGYGASNISGGPYHIKWTASDGASIGNRDNQIMGSAIIFVDTTISTMVRNTNGTSDTANDTNIIDGGNAALGDTVYDTVTLGGATSDAGGTVDYYYKKTGTEDCSGGTLLSTEDVINGVVDPSSTVQLTSAGTYEFWAEYSGDSHNNSSATDCGDETVVVPKASPDFSTQASPTTSLVVGTQYNVGDTATFTGGYNVSGSVTFTLYSDSGCTTSTGVTDTDNTIVSNVASTTGLTFTPSATGTYYWGVSYSGDANNNAITEVCGGDNETLTVIPASPTGSTAPAAQIRDTFTISGGYNPTGTVDFELWDNASCSTDNGGSMIDSDTGVALANGTATSKWIGVAEGTYYWNVFFDSSSANNNDYGPICGEMTSVDLP